LKQFINPMNNGQSPTVRSNSFWVKEIILLLFIVISGSLVVNFISQAIIYFGGIDLNLRNFDYLPADEKGQLAWYYRLILLLNHLFIFILPALLFFIVREHRSIVTILPFKKLRPAPLTYAIIMLIASYPLVSFISLINKSIPLPHFMEQLEDQSLQILQLLLGDHQLSVLLANLFVIAIIPAIGEELLFRGCLQTILHKWSKNPHVAIWITAVTFSALHLQFEGFLPRMVLGLVMGYLFYWSGNILYPIIAHLFNNALQIIIQYMIGNNPASIKEVDDYTFPFPLVIISIILLMYATWWYRASLQEKKV